MLTQPEVTGSAKTQVMVVDDSVVVRGLMGRLIDAQPDMQVAITASQGEMALFELRRRAVDVIVLDLEMPVMDGLTALPLLLAERPGVKVLIASTLTRRNGETGLKALHLGASDYLPKPEAGHTLVTAEDFQRELLAKIRALSPKGAGVARPAPPVGRWETPALPRTPGPVLTPARVDVVAIGGSTGAPPVLVHLFERLRQQIRQPILITQHMPPIFTALLAEQLARASGRPAAEARDGEPIVPGRTYVAPGGWHMRAVRENGTPMIRLDQEPPENFCRPAVDPMLRSLADTYGRGVLALILTGMGSDGAKGCEAVSAAGGRCAVQDEASSAVWGMPGAVARAGLAEQILAERDLASFLMTAAAPR